MNVVVDFHTGGQESRQNAKSRYNNNSVTVIGGFRGRKEAGSKILIHVNKTIGSAKGSQNNVALRTGGWDSDVVLSVDVGSSGRLYGAGGDGGEGSDSFSDAGSNNATSGGNGTSALGIEHEETAVNIQSGGRIRCGFGGGGGGSGARQVDSGADRSACGGGGGGGAGLPAGNAGDRFRITLILQTEQRHRRIHCQPRDARPLVGQLLAMRQLVVHQDRRCQSDVGRESVVNHQR